MILYFLSWLVVGVLVGLAYGLYQVDADRHDSEIDSENRKDWAR